MGGMVNVAIRFQNGETICQNHWTNPTSLWFKNAKMYKGDQSYIQKYLDTQKDDPDFRPLAPDGYGLTVFDYMTNNLLTMQGYSNYNDLHYSTLLISKDDDDFVGSIEGLIAEDRLSLITLQKDGDTTLEAIPKCSFATLLFWLGKLNPLNSDSIDRYYFLKIDTKPLVYTTFDEDLDGAKAFKTKLAELGFTFDKQAESAWQEWFVDQRG